MTRTPGGRNAGPGTRPAATVEQPPMFHRASAMPNLAPFCSPARRRWIRSAVLATLGGLAAGASGRRKTLTVYTFGDSVLDCARYNEHGVHPGQLLVRNDDALFPEFAGRDLQTRGPARLVHRAVD